MKALRAILLLGGMAAGGGGDTTVQVAARAVVCPRGELAALRSVSGAQLLQSTEYRPEGEGALAIEISGPGRNLDAAGIAALLMPGAGSTAAAAVWSVLAMLARLPAALVSAPNGAGGVRFTILFCR